MKDIKVRLLLDSGAYGAWRRGKTIDLDTYCDFIEENKNFVTSYVCLDTIPGSFGKMDKGQREIEVSAQLSFENQLKMRKRGLSPIPVFHQGEQFHWLKKMLDNGEPYIGI